MEKALEQIFNNLDDREAFEYQLKRDAQEQRKQGKSYSGIAEDNKRLDIKFGGQSKAEKRRLLKVEKKKRKAEARAFRKKQRAENDEFVRKLVKDKPKKKRRSKKPSARRIDYETYLRSPEWGQVRAKVLVRDGHKCLGCGSTDSLHVHHFHYRTFKNETGAELVTLCQSCHFTEHKKYILKARESYWLTRTGVTA